MGEDYANYHRANGVPNPLLEHIIVFRDGVSEGEYERVFEMEIKQIESRLFLLVIDVPDQNPNNIIRCMQKARGAYA